MFASCSIRILLFRFDLLASFFCFLAGWSSWAMVERYIRVLSDGFAVEEFQKSWS